MDKYKDIISQPPLGKLNTGLLFLDFEKLNSEPEYEALDRITFGYGVVQKRYQYSQELVRALTEAKLTIKLRSLIDSKISIEEKTFEPEELITYYDGIFLDYIHQIKDKILRLVWWMMQNDKTKCRVDEPEHIRLKSLSPYKDILQEIGIIDLLGEWSQDSSTGIAIALKKRTQHHHFTSRLQLNSDFQKIKMSKSMLDPTGVNMLSEYGKKKMLEIGDEAYKKWSDEVAEKHSKTLEQVENNLNEIATKLIDYYKVPIDPKQYADVINEYAENQKRYDITNNTSHEKIPNELKDALTFFISACKEFLKGHLVSIYITGSIPRGEYIHDSSDINFIVITDFDSHEFSLKDGDPRFNVQLFSEKEFLSVAAKKYRFICWSDGLLLYGKKFVFDKKEFPKPGTLLSLLLNRDFIKELERIKSEVSKLDGPSKQVLHYYSVKTAKIMLHFGFGVAMANKPYFTSSMKEKVQYIIKQFPSEKKRTQNMESIYYGGIIRQEDFTEIIDNFINSEKLNYEKMLKVEAEISKEK